MATSAPASPFTGVLAQTAAMHAPYRWDTPASLSDDAYLDNMAVAIRANVAGALAVRCADGSTHVMNFTAGETRVGQFTQLRSTDTVTITAADLEVAYQD